MAHTAPWKLPEFWGMTWRGPKSGAEQGRPKTWYLWLYDWDRSGSMPFGARIKRAMAVSTPEVAEVVGLSLPAPAILAAVVPIGSRSDNRSIGSRSNRQAGERFWLVGPHIGPDDLD